MTTELDLHWLAGLLEGEGSFLKPTPSHPNQLRISLQMTDEDVVSRVSALWGIKYHAVTPANPNHKTIYVINLRGKRANEWMITLFPLMGQRRRKQITEALKTYDPDRSTRFHTNQRVLTEEAVIGAKLNIEKGATLRAEARRLGVHHESLRRRIIV